MIAASLLLLCSCRQSKFSPFERLFKVKVLTGKIKMYIFW